MFEEMQNIELC